MIRFYTFDANRPELQAIIREIDPSGRIKEKEVLIKFLSKTYSRHVAEKIVNFLAKHFFGDFKTSLKPNDYVNGIQKFVNSKSSVWHQFRMAVYDGNNENKITEEGLFKFVQQTSIKPSANEHETAILLKRHEFEPDIFL